MVGWPEVAPAGVLVCMPAGVVGWAPAGVAVWAPAGVPCVDAGGPDGLCIANVRTDVMKKTPVKNSSRRMELAPELIGAVPELVCPKISLC